MRKRLFVQGLVAALLCLGSLVNAAEPFVVEEIRVEGLRRISEGTVFNYLPVTVGEQVDDQRIQESVRALFDTGFFNDIRFLRDGSTLIVEVAERPSIRAFSVEGNKDIKDEDLQPLLRSVGLARGRVLDRSVLDSVMRELRSQYYARGKYGVIIETDVEDVGNNQVEVAIDITEGKRARIRRLNIVGNQAFDEEDILDEFTLKEPHLLAFLKQDDRYSGEELVGDLETLRSYYMDRGFANFSLDSAQVTLSPDKKDLYVSLHITEGGRYRVRDVDIAGDLPVPEDQLRSLISVEPGSVFNRANLMNTSEAMTLRLGIEGYSFARADPIPEFDHESREVDITFLVDPGNRVYVRNIRFRGSESTDDEVFRREMRQLESGWVSTPLIERSKVRLQRLPFVEDAEIETQRVPGSPDLVDLDVSIEERPPGNFNFGLGFSDSRGLILSGGVTHSNFLGRGERVDLQVSTSNINKTYSVSHTDPYFTPEGVSRTLSAFYRDTSSLVVSGSNFNVNLAGLGAQIGYPISEYSRLSFGVNLNDAELLLSGQSSEQAREFVFDNGDLFVQAVRNFQGNIVGQRSGTKFRNYELSMHWTRDTRNRAIFATKGSRLQLGGEVTVPGSGVEYFITRAEYLKMWPLSDNFTLAWNTELAYGDGFGDTTALPPYKNFFVGGPDSVRGYRERWLGPKDSNLRPYGGNAKLASQLELILPSPEGVADTTRFAVFYDMGNVFYEGDGAVFFDPQTGNLIDYGFDTSRLRRSYGVAATWLGPMGAMKFSFAIPVNPFPGDGIIPADDTERFQFTISNVF